MAKTNLHNFTTNTEPQRNPPPPYTRDPETQDTMNRHSNERLQTDNGWFEMEMVPIRGQDLDLESGIFMPNREVNKSWFEPLPFLRSH